MDDIQIKQLKQMNIIDLEKLASDIREEIISSVSQNGGHLSSNLGMVELTIALHKVFDSPNDLIIYDVSHQTYAHKLLTGRKLTNLRKFNGLSGFSKISESQHDVYEAGHSSTSISAAIGFLEAKQNNNNIKNIISVIGDSSITNGLAFEALNYLGAQKDKKAIIILNDNQMSVSKSVGSLALSFNKIRVRGNFKLLRKITPKGIKKMLKSFAYRQNIFEYLGFRYFEGIDGHNIKELIRYLNYAKESSKSIVLHVKTIKGKGYKFAEEDARGYWHHVEPFDIITGLPINESKHQSFGEAIANHLSCKIKEGHKEIKVITPAMTLGSGLSMFSQTHRDNFIDVGIAEENAVTISSSMVLGGLKPFVFIYSTFLQRAYDQIIHDVARLNLPVVFCIDRCGIIDGDGDTHQGIYDLSFLSSIPNLEVLAVKNIEEAKYAIDYSLNCNHPLAIRYAKNDRNSLFTADNDFSKWDIIKEGKIAVISYGNMLSDIYASVDNLDVALINAKNLTTIDTDILKKYNKLIVIEEVIDNGSLGDKLIKYCYKNNLSNNIKTYNLGMRYLEVGDRDNLIKKYIGNLNDIIGKEIEC